MSPTLDAPNHADHVTPHRVILIAAGKGSRLKDFTRAVPKCMVKVNGVSILERQISALQANNITDFHVVRGYLADKLLLEDKISSQSSVTYYENFDYESNNILHSLMVASSAFDRPLLTTYSDIIYSKDVVSKLLETPGDVVLVVDRLWHTSYEGRTDHPVEQAELVHYDEAKGVTAVGKWIGPEEAVGEFIGLAKFSKRGAELAVKIFDEMSKKFQPDDPTPRSPLFRKAYLAELFETMINSGIRVDVAFIDGGWREIDTVQDLASVSATEQ